MADDEQEYKVEYIDSNPEECNWLKREGRVKVTYPNGDNFEGYIDKTKLKQGEGKYTWVERGEEVKEIASFQGNYVAGRKNGLGKMIFPTGDTYHGIWKDDKMEGEGTYIYANGDIFSGIFVRGIKQGAGTYEFKKDQSKFIGNWVNGSIVDGKWIFQDGGFYTGRFENGMPTGPGCYNLHNKLQQQGQYTRIEQENESGDITFKPKWTPEPVITSHA